MLPQLLSVDDNIQLMESKEELDRMINAVQQCNISMDSEELTAVVKFRYVGVKFSEDGSGKGQVDNTILIRSVRNASRGLGKERKNK